MNHKNVANVGDRIEVTEEGYANENMFEDSQTYLRKVVQTRMDILMRYTDENDEGDWVVAWSGGKDSTVVLGLVTEVVKALPPEQRKRKIHVIMSDTRVENPLLGTYMYDQVERFNVYSNKHGLPMKAEIVARPVENSYFVLTLGRGYFLPMRNGQGRWCTGRLKIGPSNAKFADIKPSFKVVGTRTGESTSRAESISKYRIDHKIAEDEASSESLLFMPIVDWSIDDVWAYLSEDNLGWSSTLEVRNLYKEATGECGVSNPKGVETRAQAMEACGARFGCWLCPVITSDRSTEEMSITNRWMEPLTEWRELQMKVYGQFKPERPKGQPRKERSKDLRKWEAINERVKLITKAGFNRSGKRMKDGQGTFTVEARQYLFDSLLQTQNTVNMLRSNEGLSYIELIYEEKISIIKETWEDDRKNYTHLVTNEVGASISELEALLNEKV